MSPLADFPRAATLGFEAGKGRAVPSATHLLIKGMLAERETLLKRKFELEKGQVKFGQEVALAGEKQRLKEVSPLTQSQIEKNLAQAEKAKRGKAPTERKITSADVTALGEMALAKGEGPSLLKRLGAKIPFFGGAAQEEVKQFKKAKGKFGGVSPDILQQFQAQFQRKGADFFKSSNVIEYTQEEERLIADNMKAHNRSREEVIERLQALGHLQ